MNDRAEIMTQIACACIQAGIPPHDALDYASTLADAILAPVPIIDHKLARDLDRALRGGQE